MPGAEAGGRSDAHSASNSSLSSIIGCKPSCGEGCGFGEELLLLGKGGVDLSPTVSDVAAWLKVVSEDAGNVLTASTQGAKVLVRFLCAKPEPDHAAAPAWGFSRCPRDGSRETASCTRL